MPSLTTGVSVPLAVPIFTSDRSSVNVPALSACMWSTARLPVVETPESRPVMSVTVFPLWVPALNVPNIPPSATVRLARDESNPRSHCAIWSVFPFGLTSMLTSKSSPTHTVDWDGLIETIGSAAAAIPIPALKTAITRIKDSKRDEIPPFVRFVSILTHLK